MQRITTIDQLIECFDDAEPSEQVSVLKSIDISTAEFEKYATWKDGCYTRNCLARRDGFEFILLCWSTGASTPIHGHGGQNCWVYQVSGEIRERRYNEHDGHFEVVNEAILNEGRITFMHDRMGYHTLENISDGKAMTLHVYANPIDRCKVYNDEKGRFEIKEMEYDTVDGEVVLKTGS